MRIEAVVVAQRVGGAAAGPRQLAGGGLRANHGLGPGRQRRHPHERGARAAVPLYCLLSQSGCAAPLLPLPLPTDLRGLSKACVAQDGCRFRGDEALSEISPVALLAPPRAAGGMPWGPTGVARLRCRPWHAHVQKPQGARQPQLPHTPPPSAQLFTSPLLTGCSMMASKRRVPRSAFVSGRWPRGASAE